MCVKILKKNLLISLKLKIPFFHKYYNKLININKIIIYSRVKLFNLFKI